LHPVADPVVQSMPGGLLTTWPLPSPTSATVRTPDDAASAPLLEPLPDPLPELLPEPPEPLPEPPPEPLPEPPPDEPPPDDEELPLPPPLEPEQLAIRATAAPRTSATGIYVNRDRGFDKACIGAGNPHYIRTTKRARRRTTATLHTRSARRISRRCSWRDSASSTGFAMRDGDRPGLDDPPLRHPARLDGEQAVVAGSGRRHRAAYRQNALSLPSETHCVATAPRRPRQECRASHASVPKMCVTG